MLSRLLTVFVTSAWLALIIASAASAQYMLPPPPLPGVERLPPLVPDQNSNLVVPEASESPDSVGGPESVVSPDEVVETAPDGSLIPSFGIPMIESDGVPTWYNPITWLSPTFWDGSFEVGINGTEGNANAFSLRTGFDLSRETENTNWDIDFTYGKALANGVETQNNALMTSDWDYQLRHPRWSWFNKLGLEYDEFKNFDLRVFLNTGFGYLIVDNDTTQLRGRAGAGTSKEFDSPDDEWKPEAVFGADFSHQLTKKQKLSLVVDYFPTWEDFSDYRMIADAGWEVVLDEASNLSLKLGVIDRYDSTPNGAKRNDVDYSLLLLWKL